MKKTAKELIEHCKKAVKNNVQYIYGAKMEVMSYDKIKALQNMYGYNYVWAGDLKKAGKLCCDCSGVISSCTGILRSSSGYKQTAEKVLPIKDIKKNWNKYIGWGLWLNGHIGVVSDKEGYYYACDGSARNMVHYPLNKQNWLYALKLCDIDYTEAKQEEKIKQGDNEMVETGYIKVNGKDIKINKILKDGRNFIELRGLENAGFNVDFDKNTKCVILNNEVKKIPLIVDNETTSVETVNINGLNYCALRNIALVTGSFDVDYADGNVVIETKKYRATEAKLYS